MKYPDGASQEFGAELQVYIAGKASKEDTMKAMDHTWAKFKNKLHPKGSPFSESLLSKKILLAKKA